MLASALLSTAASSRTLLHLGAPVVFSTLHRPSSSSSAASRGAAASAFVRLVQGPSSVDDAASGDAGSPRVEWCTDAGGVLRRRSAATAASSPQARGASSLPLLVSALLPHGWPASVAPGYAGYARWAAAGAAFSAATGVLSTQALLVAVGVGAGTAVPLAAAANWALKDGLGQLGGVAAVALVRNRFDVNPKCWRLAAAAAQDVAAALELLTPLLPAAFLPLAVAANVCKNVAWLSASAARAGLHSALAVHGNLADVTAKAGSQTMASSTAGMLLAAALAPSLGGAPSAMLAAFAVCSAAHLACVYLSLRRVVLPSLSQQRLALALEPALSGGAGAGGAVRTPADVCAVEAFAAPPALRAAWRRMRGSSSSGGGGDGDAGEAAAAAVRVGSTLAGGWRAAALRRFADASRTETSRYIVAVRWPQQRSGGDSSAAASEAAAAAARVHLFFTADAGWRECILGYAHALHVARQTLPPAVGGGSGGGSGGNSDADFAAVEHGARFIDAHGARLVNELELAGWWVGQPVIEQDFGRRLHLLRTEAPSLS